MKRAIYFSLFTVCMFLISACSGGTSSPGEAAKTYMGYLADGKYEKFVDALAKKSENVSKEEFELQKKQAALMIEQKAGKSLKEKGGLKNIEIISEEIDEDGNSAEVALKLTYGNGDTNENDYKMVKQDGKWKFKN